MAVGLHALDIDAVEPQLLADFWAAVLGWPVVDDPGGPVVRPDDDTGFLLRFRPARGLPTGPNQLHLDLTSTSPDDQRATVARALAHGGRHHDVGQGPEVTHVVLADPEGNAFCVIAPGNAFLADCGTIGALAGDGMAEVGYFWSTALGWPLVWDQDQETAIRSPHGGPKITWGGPPVPRKVGRNRLRFHLAPTDDAEPAAEVERLIALGATRIGAGPDWVELTDPGGNEFRVG